uniref:Putative secreted peptide n=1 Tax=Anopheles braziliensis TaxID=58242 RepID=A0A2M3ZN00_9DIPT
MHLFVDQPSAVVLEAYLLVVQPLLLLLLLVGRAGNGHDGNRRSVSVHNYRLRHTNHLTVADCCTGTEYGGLS